MNNAPMIGSRRHTGPGGRNCACCNVAPRQRKRDKRMAKRSERQKVRKALSNI